MSPMFLGGHALLFQDPTEPPHVDAHAQVAYVSNSRRADITLRANDGPNKQQILNAAVPLVGGGDGEAAYILELLGATNLGGQPLFVINKQVPGRQMPECLMSPVIGIWASWFAGTTAYMPFRCWAPVDHGRPRTAPQSVFLVNLCLHIMTLQKQSIACLARKLSRDVLVSKTACWHVGLRFQPGHELSDFSADATRYTPQGVLPCSLHQHQCLPSTSAQLHQPNIGHRGSCGPEAGT
jgi:hypothetical protein